MHVGGWDLDYMHVALDYMHVTFTCTVQPYRGLIPDALHSIWQISAYLPDAMRPTEFSF